VKGTLAAASVPLVIGRARESARTIALVMKRPCWMTSE